MKPKAIVKKVDKYEIHLAGDNSYRSCKTEVQAKKIAKEMVAEEQASLDAIEDRKKQDVAEAVVLRCSLTNYIGKLKQDLWHFQRIKPKSDADTMAKKDVISQLKQVVKNLEGFRNGTVRCDRGTGWSNNTEYSIREAGE